MNLSVDQVSRIQFEVDRNNITIATLRDDLIDHLCCVVEGKMKNGKSFEISFTEALNELAPEGLHSIQDETSAFPVWRWVWVGP